MEPAPFPVVISRRARGFTLIEMLVVLSIITVLATIMLTGQSTYNQTLVLSDTAYNVAFDARQAQSYGLSNRAFSTAIHNLGYGLDFNRVTPTKYTFFADTMSAGAIPSRCTVGTAGDPDAKPGDCFYTPGSDSVVKTTTFTRGFTVGQFCGIELNGTAYCSTYATPLDSLDIVFIRPNTKTIITGKQGNFVREMTCAQIRLNSPTGGTSKTIRISQFGEISLNQFCSPLTS